MIPVKEHPNLYRDENSGAIINCDDQAYNQYMSTINNKKRERYEIEQIKNDISEIKSLLVEILNGTK
jgi:hypothetical protein